MSKATRIIFSPKVDQRIIKTFLNEIYLRKKIAGILAGAGVDGASLQAGAGIWQGNFEPSYTLYLIGITKRKAGQIADAIKQAFTQDAVILERVSRDISFI